MVVPTDLYKQICGCSHHSYFALFYYRNTLETAKNAVIEVGAPS